MSKLNSLIGFWNNKSLEEGDNRISNSPKKMRPKSEILDHNFSQRMEMFSSPKNLRGEDESRNVHHSNGSYKVSSDGDDKIKDKVKISDDKGESDTVVDKIAGEVRNKVKCPSVIVTEDADTSSNIASNRKSAGDDGVGVQNCETGGKSQFNRFQSPPVSPLVKSPPSTPTSPCSPSWRSSPSSNKPQSPFSKFKQLEDNILSSSCPGNGSRTPPPSRPTGGSSLYRNLSMPASTPRPTLTVKMMEQGSQKTTGGSSLAARSGSGAKEMILMWVQNRIKDYPIPMTNFSTCWNNGLAFCALIHVFYPDNFDWYSLKPENRRHNFTLAFQKAEELAGIYPLLEVDDMVRFQKPDWKCVFTYVQSFYRRFRDGRSPSPKPPVGAGVKMSEVALAVAECQAAEQRGRQIVLEVKQEVKPEVKNEVKTGKDKENDVKEITQIENTIPSKEEKDHDKELNEKVDDDKSIDSTPEEDPETRLNPVQVAQAMIEECPDKPSHESNPSSDPVHTQVASITLKPSPAKLSPSTTVKLNRSRSVNTEHPGAGDDDQEKAREQQRKFSYSHPMPSMSPPALKL